jgi:hypothetical protein
MAQGLKKGEITLKEVYQLTVDYYKTKKDISKSRPVYSIKHMISEKAEKDATFDKEKGWTREGKSAKITFIVECKEMVATPDKKSVAIKATEYPVVFIINDIGKKLESTFKWRTGGDREPIFQKAGMSLMEREHVTTTNRKNGVYLPFFFELEGVLPLYDLLEGKNFTNSPPKKTNPDLIPYFDKLALFVFENALINLFNDQKAMDSLLGK